MRRVLLTVMALLGGLLPCFAALADDFEIVATVTVGQEKFRTERTEQATPKRNTEKQDAAPRVVISIEAAKTTEITWRAKNTSKTAELKDVLMHCFVVKEKELGQQEVPDLAHGIYEGALTMDFKPGETADWQFKLKIDEPGNYLLRVETVGLAPAHGHDHFAAFDLSVK